MRAPTAPPPIAERFMATKPDRSKCSTSRLATISDGSSSALWIRLRPWKRSAKASAAAISEGRAQLVGVRYRRRLALARTEQERILWTPRDGAVCVRVMCTAQRTRPKSAPIDEADPREGNAGHSAEVDLWLAADAPKALELQRPLPDDVLRIVASGEKEDGLAA